MTENRKPFGLTLACKVASDAIRESVAPVSIILYNLLALQKSTIFPKNLDTQFFSNNKTVVTDLDKRVVAKVLDELRGPHLDKAGLLESYIKQNWVIKKAPLNQNVQNVKNETKGKNFVNTKSKAKSNKNDTKKPNAKIVAKDIPAPVVIIKKSKLI